MLSKAIIVGRIGSIRELEGEIPHVIISVAHRYWRKGEEKTDWIPVHAYGSLAENIVNYFDKGDAVVVDGTIRAYQDQEGKTRLAIYADRIQKVAPGAAGRKKTTETEEEEVEERKPRKRKTEPEEVEEPEPDEFEEEVESKSRKVRKKPARRKREVEEDDEELMF